MDESKNYEKYLTLVPLVQKKGSLSIGCGTLKGASISLAHNEPVILGRAADICNLVVEDSAVSRKHCMVIYNAVKDTYLLMDTSSNGTYLQGGQRLPKNFAMEIQSGFSFYLGVPDNRFHVGTPR